MIFTLQNGKITDLQAISYQIKSLVGRQTFMNLSYNLKIDFG